MCITSSGTYLRSEIYEHKYGFRPSPRQEHALSAVNKNIQCSHFYYVVDIDIKGFDNVKETISKSS